MFDIKKLREERKALVDQMTNISVECNKSSRSMNTEEMSTWDNLDSAQKELLSKIETAERFASVPAPQEVAERAVEQAVRNTFNRSEATAYDCNQAVRGFLLRNCGQEVPEECKRAAAKLRLDINTRSMPAQFRDQTIGSVGTGGNVVSQGPFMGFEKKMKAYGGFDSFCKVLNTSSGNVLPLYGADDTANLGTVEPELDASVQTAFAVTKSTLSAFRISSAIYKVSKELMADSDINLADFMTDILAERLARKASALYVSGAGTTEPLGIAGQSANSGISLASATAITYAELVNIYHSLDPAYRANASWVFNDNTLSILKKMVDGETGRPLWMPSLVQAAPDQLLGKPFHIVQEVPSISGDAVKCMYFGDFSKVYIRTVGGVDIQTLNELYALEYAIGVCASLRTDILNTNTSAVNYVLSLNS